MACSVNECRMFPHNEMANIIITILRHCIPRYFDLFTRNSCVGSLTSRRVKSNDFNIFLGMLTNMGIVRAEIFLLERHIGLLF